MDDDLNNFNFWDGDVLIEMLKSICQWCRHVGNLDGAENGRNTAGSIPYGEAKLVNSIQLNTFVENNICLAN